MGADYENYEVVTDRVFVKCRHCGGMNMLRQVGPPPRPMSRNELFMAEIDEIVEGLDAEGERARVVAAETARRILEMLRPSAERFRQGHPFYRVEVLDRSDAEWYTITTKTG